MPFAGYKDFADCVAKNQDKGDPEAYCAVIKRQVEGEKLRHPDFQKIYRQFQTVENGENRYLNWINALNLDETKPYGDCFKEQFGWIKRHTDLRLWNEDSRNKYWKFEAAFPVESMNGNVYTREELIRAARTLVGKSVNLNHKYPLPTIEIVASEEENGIVEGVIKVPNTLKCPICDENKTINELIEQKGIYNNSLEAGCTFESEDRKCEGMYFTGLALLTTKVLPGIPLTRLKPLEGIMVEALQSSTRRRKNVKTIKMEVLEEDEPEPCPEGQKRNPETGKCEPIPPEEMQTVDITPVQPKPSMEPDENGQCQHGYMLNAIGKCVPTEDCGEGRHWDANANDGQGACVADTPPKPEHPETSHGLPAAPQEDVLTDAPTEQPTAGEQPPITGTKPIPSPSAAGEQPTATGHPPEVAPAMKPNEPGEIEPEPSHDCGDGYHYDFDLNQCVPDHPINERVKRFQAEDKADTLKTQVAKWESRYISLDTEYQRLLGVKREQQQTIRRLEQQNDRNNVEKVNDEVQLRDKTRRIEDLTIARDDYKQQLEKLKKLYDDQSGKYHSTLAVNLELSRKLTKANEDYLDVATERDRFKEAINKAKSISKKVVKIRV